VDMGRGWGRLGGLDLPSLNLVFYCKERDRGPVNERSIISLREPLPGLQERRGGQCIHGAEESGIILAVCPREKSVDKNFDV
jgi:hypothetical protein